MDTTLHVNDVVEDISKESIQSVDVPFKGLHDWIVIYELSLQPLVLVHTCKRRLQENEHRNVGPPLKKIKTVNLVKSIQLQRDMQVVESNTSGIMKKYIMRFHACVRNSWWCLFWEFGRAS